MTVGSDETMPASVPMTPLVICAPDPAEDTQPPAKTPTSVPALPLLIGGAAKPPTDLDGAEHEVMLRFPAESIGMYVLSRKDEQPVYGYAQGEVRVPAGRSVQLNVNDNVTDGSALAGLPPDGVQVLTATGLDDEAMDVVAGLHGLTYLHIGAQVTDAGLAKLAGLTDLTMLTVRGGGSISDAAVPHLLALPNLRSLHLLGATLTDAGVAGLARLEHLIALDVTSPNLTNASITALADLPELGTLSLGGDGLDDAGLLAFASGFPALKQATIHSPRITHDGVLAAFSAGIRTELNGQWFSPKGVERLRRSTDAD